MEGLSVFLSSLGSNTMFVGLSMIFMQFGSRFVLGDITVAQQQMFASEIMKKVIVFCMFFVPTRDVKVAIMLTFAFFFVTKTLLNENTRFNILKSEPFEQQATVVYDVYSQAATLRSNAK